MAASRRWEPDRASARPARLVRVRARSPRDDRCPQESTGRFRALWASQVPGRPIVLHRVALTWGGRIVLALTQPAPQVQARASRAAATVPTAVGPATARFPRSHLR